MTKEYSKNTQTLVDRKRRRIIYEDTGEVADVEQVTKIAFGQKQFWKVYLMDFLQVLGVLDSKQIDILIYLLENTEPANNTFVGTYAKIQKETGISQMTISRVLKKLQDNKFITKIQNGVWQVSPHIMMKGNDYKKQMLITYYQDNVREIACTTSKEPNNKRSSI